VICVHQQLGADALARRVDLAQPGRDVPITEKHRGHHHGGGAVVYQGPQALGDRGRGGVGNPHDLDPLLRQTIELASQRVELAIGRDEARAFP